MPELSLWLSLLWMVICVVLIAGLAYCFTKYVASRKGLGVFGFPQDTGMMKVLARMTLGKEQLLMLVQVGERYFLLGVTPAEISTLAEFTQEEAAAWPQPPQPAALPSFRESLSKVLQQKRQR